MRSDACFNFDFLKPHLSATPSRPDNLRLSSWTDSDVLHLDTKEVVNVLNILLGILWQFLPGLHASGVAVPAWQSLVVNLDLVEHVEICREGR